MRKSLSMVLIAVLSTAVPATAQVATQEQETPPPSFSLLGMIVYPAEDQSPEQQVLDEAACWDWAETNTGMKIVIGSVDTEAAAQQAGDQAAEATAGAAVGGAARGALAGLAIGAIAGDAGKGAAIGAAAGGMGGIRGRRAAIAASEQQGAEAAAAANEEAINQFKNAGSVCLQGRGYAAR
jgi:hypothetical protein